MSRYARQIILPEIGEGGQARLSAAHVLVIGAGGLAAAALPLLAGAGVGALTIVDGDQVEQSNLHRQHLFTEADCGQHKAEVASARCRAINNDISVTAINGRLTPATAPALVAGADLIIDCADSYAVSYTLSDLCHDQRKPLISASVLGFGGYVGGFCGGGPSLRALFPDAPDNGASCATAGVMAPVVTMIGALQAQMALAHLAALTPAPLGQLMQIDARTWRTASFRFDNAAEPEESFRFIALDEIEPLDLVVELRGEDEAPQPLYPGALRLPPPDLRDNLPLMSTRLVLCCATGLRSWRAAEQLYPDWPGEMVLVAASAS